MLIEEVWIDKTRNLGIGESGKYEPFTDDLSQLYKHLVKDYGRCTGKVRIDPDGKPVGWVFEKKVKYTDSDETYIQETWVTLYEKEDTVVRTHHYKFLED